MPGNANGPAEQPAPRLNRRQRRERQRAVIKQLLDGPPRKPVCGQAKAAARNRDQRDALSKEPKVPKGNTQEKKAARALQAATGDPYSTCLAAVRAQHAARSAATPQPRPTSGQ